MNPKRTNKIDPLTEKYNEYIKIPQQKKQALTDTSTTLEQKITTYKQILKKEKELKNKLRKII